ncbi:hypothetical protein D6T51_07595 [Salmonella enterica subsp. enterica serovar Muenchen]|uniref:Uncharacterized protein n=1 Tax=Salmonella enterica subsp. enterica serovar Ank TaxID=1173578 RepID=A0A726YAN8_SALET|nr:hypothetical protein [Salmonella enterica subsp. enterica serovar Muenchen]EJM3644011.1 hypothetical protein [Salmonella enterica]HAE1795862.1 hypothetical protein [Salmonella enterica subsp. enterica serovar Ank]
MGGGGKSNEVKETSQQRAQAEIAARQWSLYSNELKPMENIFMQKVDSLNDESRYDKLAGTTHLGYQQEFSGARKQTATQMTAGGVDPGSGKFQGALGDIESDLVTGQTDTTNRAQTSQADKYIAGLQDIVSLGAGQKADALSGYSSLASNSLQKAGADAQAAYARRQGNASLVGAGLGAVAGYASNKLGSGTGLSTPKTSGTGANAIQNYAGSFNL